MGDFLIHVEWLEAEDVRGPELAATWCRLSMEASGEQLLRVHDEVSKTVRDAIYTPAYVFAEWLVERYPLLLNEYSSGAVRDASWKYRHNLLCNREGYIFPEFCLYPRDAASVVIEVRPVRYESERKTFLADVQLVRDRDAVEHGLSTFITTVIERLESFGITDSHLSERWAELTGHDSEEWKYIHTVAAMGRHYADISAEEDAEFLSVSAQLSPESIEALSRHLDFEMFVNHAPRLGALIRDMKQHSVDAPALAAFRRRVASSSHHASAPWQIGYELARKLRGDLDAADECFRSIEEIDELMGLSPATAEALRGYSGKAGPLLAMIMATGEQGVRFEMAEQKRAQSRLFSWCRALGEYLHTHEQGLRIISSVDDWNQQMNRAFAAEFLVPIAALRKRVAGEELYPEDIRILADEWNVSELLIMNQLMNQSDIHVIGGEWCPRRVGK
jgi:hypothetical protein